MELRNHEHYKDPTAYEALKAVENRRKFRPFVYICSRYAGDTKRNTRLARNYCRFAMNREYIPLAPHLLFPQFLNDKNPRERKLGLEFDKDLMDICSEVWVFIEDGIISEGMKSEIKYAKSKGYILRYFEQEES